MDKSVVEKPLDRSVTLILSHRCNLNCSYCYQRHDRRDSATMPLELAQKLIKKEFENVPEGGSLGIVLMGGEPLIDWTQVKMLCEWVFSQVWSRSYRIIVSTNGTLITNEMKDWFKAHKNQIIVGLSYDGDEQMQNANRNTGGFNIDLNFFFETWGRTGVKMTLSAETVGRLYEGLRYLHENCGMGVGYKPDTRMDENAIGCNLAYGIDFGPVEYYKLKGELEKLIEYYLGDGKDFTPATILNLDLSYCPPEINPDKVGKYCGVGTEMSCYDTDGKWYPCQYFIPLTQPEENLRRMSEVDFGSFKKDPACGQCPIETLCPTCYGNNFLKNGDPFVRDKSLCPFFKLIFLANCILQTRRLLRKGEKTDKEVYTMRIVEKIYARLLKDTKDYEAQHPRTQKKEGA